MMLSISSLVEALYTLNRVYAVCSLNHQVIPVRESFVRTPFPFLFDSSTKSSLHVRTFFVLIARQISRAGIRTRGLLKPFDFESMWF